jgi:hypothetical protein
MAGSKSASQIAAAAKDKQPSPEELQARRDAALLAAQKAEQEAAAAARARDALKRAAEARAEAALGDPDAAKRDGDGDASSLISDKVAPDDDLHRAMVVHEAAAVVNLHHHAASVQNIRNLVHVVLDLTDDNYKRWRDQLLLVVGKYSLEDHILQDTPAPGFPDWRRMDCVVKSWISGTISSDLAEAVMGRDATARDVWLALEDQFLGNQETRALHLDAKFRHFCQGELSITDYCRRFKNMADSLGDLGEPVTDRTLVLNVIRGLADRFHDVGRHLRLSRDFPTFLEVRSALILEELTMDQRASTPSTALLASDDKQPAGSTSSSSRRPPTQQQQQPGAGTRGSSQQQQRPPSNRRSKRAGKGTQQRGSTSPATPAAPPSVASSGGSGGPWPSPQHPWSGAIHMWPGQQAPSLTPPQQQALLAQQ